MDRTDIKEIITELEGILPTEAGQVIDAAGAAGQISHTGIDRAPLRTTS